MVSEVSQTQMTRANLIPAGFLRLRWGLIILAYLAIGMLILNFNVLVPTDDTLQLEVDDVPNDDIYAPVSLSYESTVLTDQARQTARDTTPPVYDRLFDETSEHLELTQEIVDYMNWVRSDPYSTVDQKVHDLQSITLLKNVDEDTWRELLGATSSRWGVITEAIMPTVAEVMSLEIYPDGISDAQNALTSIVNPSISFVDRRIVTEIASELIIPNVRLNETATNQAQEDQAEAVQPVLRNFEEGEIVIQKGQKIRPADIEALRQFGLLQSDKNNSRQLASSFLILLMVSLVQFLYIQRFYPRVVASESLMLVLPILTLAFLAGALIFGPDGLDQQRLYPAAAMALLVTALVGPHLGTFMVAGVAILVGTMFGNSLELILLIAVGGMVGSVALQDVESLNSYFRAGFFIGIANLIIVLAFLLEQENQPEPLVFITDTSLAFLSGLLAAGVALVGLYMIGTMANLTTNIKLIELMQPNQPLLQDLLRKAPGTYQHSLQVANLSELAAERIGANASLVRVAAMYHDIGKTLNAQFFVENQAEGLNPHDEINDPFRSAALIIGHVTEGERMARRNRLPQRIRDFIREHHGTNKPMYFYMKALEQVGGDETQIDEAHFTYPGPAPQSRETAIMMLADGTESAGRAIRPRSLEAVEKVVDKIFQHALENGQLDDSGLTLADLKEIRKSFVETLQGIYHPRIAYPEREEIKAEVAPKPQLQETTQKPASDGEDVTPPFTTEIFDATETTQIKERPTNTGTDTEPDADADVPCEDSETAVEAEVAEASHEADITEVVEEIEEEATEAEASPEATAKKPPAKKKSSATKTDKPGSIEEEI